MAKFVGIYMGDYAAVGVLDTGEVVAWGDPSADVVTKLPVITDAVSAAVLEHDAFVLKSDGTVQGWGRNARGHLDGDYVLYSDFVQIAASNSGWTVGRRANGEVVAWGYDGDGVVANLPAGLSGVVDIAAGSSYAVAVLGDGSLVQWGSSLPTIPTGLPPIVQVELADKVTVALDNTGAVWWWGNHPWYADFSALTGLTGVAKLHGGGPYSVLYAELTTGELVASGTELDEDYATLAPQGVLDGTAGNNPVFGFSWYDVYVVYDDGTVHGWGENTFGMASYPLAGGWVGAAAIDAGLGHGIALLNNGEAIVWGDEDVDNPPMANDPANPYVHVAAGYYNAVVVKANGDTRSLGQSTSVPSNIGTDVVQIVGYDNYHVRREDGTAETWGNAQSGAVIPAGTSNVAYIATGLYHVVAVYNDGTAEAWGTATAEAMALSSVTGAVKAAAGQYHTLMLKGDGTVEAFAPDGNSNLLVPAEAVGVVDIAAGDDFSLALLSDGTVIGWGESWHGAIPPPAGLTGIVSVAAGRTAGHALAGTGEVFSWGDNYYGQAVTPAVIGPPPAYQFGFVVNNLPQEAASMRVDVTVAGSPATDIASATFTLGSVAVTGGTGTLTASTAGTPLGAADTVWFDIVPADAEGNVVSKRVIGPYIVSEAGEQV